MEFPGFSGHRLASVDRRSDASGLSKGRVRQAYEFIKANNRQYSVQAMCRILEVAPSGYYEWLLQPISNRAQEDARLLRLIRASFIASHGIYGAPRVFLDLREAGQTCSKHRVARLMRENKPRALHGSRVRRWSVGKPAVLIPNLLKRQFTVTRRNKAWATDITYIRTWQGWLYLAVVIAADRRLGGGTDDPSRAGAERRTSRGAPAPPTRHADSLRSGHAVWQRRVATLVPIESAGTEHEPQGQ